MKNLDSISKHTSRFIHAMFPCTSTSHARLLCKVARYAATFSFCSFSSAVLRRFSSFRIFFALASASAGVIPWMFEVVRMGGAL